MWVDPEPLLLLTLHCARWDARFFDEVLEWLAINHKWINVVRLRTLADADKVCPQSLIGAVAKYLTGVDTKPKWKQIAEDFMPENHDAASLFPSDTEPAIVEYDPLWKAYGWLRRPFTPRGSSRRVEAGLPRELGTAGLMVKSRALFGVTIRADVFAYLAALPGGANCNQAARQLGYSQRRVYDAVMELTAAGALVSRAEGKTEVFDSNSSFVKALAGDEQPVWLDWRALSRSWKAAWDSVVGSHFTENISPFGYEVEFRKLFESVRDDVERVRISGRFDADPPPEMAAQAATIVALRKPDPRNIAWTRRWLPRDRESESSARFQEMIRAEWKKVNYADFSNGLQFDQIAEFSCLVLLGEPGSGKTTEMKAAQVAADSLSGTQTVWVDLWKIENRDDLRQSIQETDAYRTFARGECDLHIFLDGLDEGRLTNPLAGSYLEDAIRSLNSSPRLRLRISCRSEAWPDFLRIETQLKKRWGDHETLVTVLAPLDASDIVKAGDSIDRNGEDFLREIQRRDVLPLAQRPVSLFMLRDIYEKHAELPSRLLDIYGEGLKALADEPGKERIERRKTGRLTPSQRLVVAERIAAATILCGGGPIWHFSARNGTKRLSVDDLVTAFADAMPNRESVLETMDTALFVPAGPDSSTWAHLTFGEYLAARWIKSAALTPAQIEDLLWTGSKGRRKVIPQLSQTAAWLAAMDREVLLKIKKTDPGILVLSDSSSLSEDDRAELVEHLLAGFGTNELSDPDRRIISRLGKLSHSRLAEQLRPWMLDATRPEFSRMVAFWMAQACGSSANVSDSLLVALDFGQPTSIRCEAVELAVELGGDEVKRKLLPLLEGGAPDDDFDSIRGHVLSHCWPDLLTTRELFQRLIPMSSSHYGAYRRFREQELPARLRPEDLPEALEWLIKRTLTSVPSGALSCAIAEKASGSLGDVRVRRGFVQLLHSLLQYDHFPENWKDQEWWRAVAERETLRRELAWGILQHEPSPTPQHFACAFHECGLIRSSDVPWLCEELQRDGQRGSVREMLIELINVVWFRLAPDQTNLVVPIFLENLELSRRFDLLPVELDSNEARKERSDYESREARRARFEDRRRSVDAVPDPGSRLIDGLKMAEESDQPGDWRIVSELLNGLIYGGRDAICLSPSAEDAWKCLSDNVRSRVIRLARRFVEECDSPTKDGFDVDCSFQISVAAVQAIFLLEGSGIAVETPLLLKWLPALVRYPVFFGHSMDQAGELIARIHAFAQENVRRVVLRQARKDFKSREINTVIRVIDKIEDVEINEEILELVKSIPIKPQVLGEVLCYLLRRGSGEDWRRNFYSVKVASYFRGRSAGFMLR